MRRAVTVRAEIKRLATIKLFFERELGYYPETMAKLHASAVEKYAQVILEHYPQFRVIEDGQALKILSEGQAEKNIEVRREDLKESEDNPMLNDVIRALEEDE
jgi:hypothetical protein